ncbi:MAG TPA: hypothetical protein VF622_03155 [Segetibacter sp.]|jgi:hypothetical protein
MVSDSREKPRLTGNKFNPAVAGFFLLTTQQFNLDVSFGHTKTFLKYNKAIASRFNNA